MDGKVTLANEVESLPFKVKHKNWYLFWGLVPLTNNKTDKKIQKYKLTKVRATTKFNFVDILIDLVSSGIVSTNTIIIEGESK